jgi:hypothetical protein
VQYGKRLKDLLRKFVAEIPPIGDTALAAELQRVQADLEEMRRACGFPPGHFYSPIPSMADVDRHAAKLFDTSSSDCPGVRLNETAQLALLDQLAPYAADIPFAARPGNGLRYGFENSFYSYSDGTFLYSMLRHHRPRRIIEIGSGFTSALILDVNERCFDNRISCTFIEPYPERLLELLKPGDEQRIDLRREGFQDVDPAMFSELAPSDMVIVDSTHVSKIGSDVNHIVFNVLPMLGKGVLIHFHDIFFPFEYPKGWVYEGRFWNEIYLLRAFLQFNSAFEIVLLTKYLERFHRERLERSLPLTARHHGAQMWLRRV